MIKRFFIFAAGLAVAAVAAISYPSLALALTEPVPDLLGFLDHVFVVSALTSFSVVALLVALVLLLLWAANRIAPFTGQSGASDLDWFGSNPATGPPS